MKRNSLATDIHYQLNSVLSSIERKKFDSIFRNYVPRNSIPLSELTDVQSMRKSSRMTGSKKVNYGPKKDAIKRSSSVQSVKDSPQKAPEKDVPVALSLTASANPKEGGGKKRKRKLTKDISDDKVTVTNQEVEASPSLEPKRKCHQKDSVDPDKASPPSGETKRKRPPRDLVDPDKPSPHGSEPKSKRQQKDSVDPDDATTSPKKPQKSNLKICANCGTTAINSKAKKCHNCMKFFYPHWASRCRIPPCPKCHFSKKARGRTMLPKTCEQCGHVLPAYEDDDKECSSVVSQEPEVCEEVGSVKSRSRTSSNSENIEEHALQQIKAQTPEKGEFPDECAGAMSSLDPVDDSNECTPIIEPADDTTCGNGSVSKKFEVSSGDRVSESDAESDNDLTIVDESESVADNTQGPSVSSAENTEYGSVCTVQTTESLTQIPASPPLVTQTTESSPLVTQTTESPPPAVQTTETLPLVTQTTGSPPPAVQTTETPVQTPPPAVQTKEIPPPPAVQTTETPPPAVQTTETPPPAVQTIESPPLVPQATETRPLVTHTQRLPPLISDSNALTTGTPSPVTFTSSQAVHLPPPLVNITEPSNDNLVIVSAKGNVSQTTDNQEMASQTSQEATCSKDASTPAKHLGRHTTHSQDANPPSFNSISSLKELKKEEAGDPSIPVVVSSYSLLNSDSLPQISAMMSNIDNAITVLTSSCPKLKKSLVEDSKEKPVSKDNYVHLAKELNELCSQSNKLGDHATTTPDHDKYQEKDKKREDASLAHYGNVEESKVKSKLVDHGFAPIAPKVPQVIGIPGFESLLSMPVSQIMSQMKMSSHLIQSLFMPNNVAITPISWAHHLQGNQGMSQPSTTSDLVLASSLSTYISALTSMSSSRPQLQVSSLPSTLMSTCPANNLPRSPQLLGQQTIPSTATAKDMMAGDPVRFSSAPTTSSPSVPKSVMTASSLDCFIDEGVSTPKVPPPLSSYVAKGSGATRTKSLGEALKVISSTYPLTCPPPLKSIPQRTEDNSVIKCPSDPDHRPLPDRSILSSASSKRQGSIGFKTLTGQRSVECSISSADGIISLGGCLPDWGGCKAANRNIVSGVSTYYPWPLRDSLVVNSSSIPTLPPEKPLASTCVTTDSDLSKGPQESSVTSQRETASESTAHTANQDLPSSAKSQTKDMDVVTTSAGTLSTAAASIGGDNGSGSGGGDGGGGDGNNFSSFHKLELSHTSTSSHTGNNIRISLLKQKSDPRPNIPLTLPLSSSSEAKSAEGTRDPPLLSPEMASTSPSLSQPLLTPPLGNKFQNFAVSPNLTVIATVETQTTRSSGSGGPCVNKDQIQPSNFGSSTESGHVQTPSTPNASSDAYTINSSSNMYTSNASSNAYTPNVSSKGFNSNAICTHIASSNVSSSNYSVSASNVATSFSGSSPPTMNCIGELETKMDPETIEKLASKVQMRIKDALSLGSPLEETEAKSTAGPPLSRTGAAGFRRILPNLTKQPTTTMSLNPPTSFSHARTPGVVTVQVCSSIPANLTLSSITNSPSSSSQDAGSEQKKSPFPGVIMPRGVVAGGGNVMVTPLSPSMLPTGRTVAQIMTSKSPVPREDTTIAKKTNGNKISSTQMINKESSQIHNNNSHDPADSSHKLFSEESLNSSLDSSEQAASEAGSTKNKKKSGSDKGYVHNDDAVEDDGKEEEEENEDDKKGDGGGGGGGGDSSKDKKKERFIFWWEEEETK